MKTTLKPIINALHEQSSQQGEGSITKNQLINSLSRLQDLSLGGIEAMEANDVTSNISLGLIEEGAMYKVVGDSIYSYDGAVAAGQVITMDTSALRDGTKVILSYNMGQDTNMVIGTGTTEEYFQITGDINGYNYGIHIFSVDTAAGSSLVLTSLGLDTISNLVLRPLLANVGPELLENTLFSSDTIWTKGGSTTISSGAAHITANGDSVYQAPAALTATEKYRATFIWESAFGSDTGTLSVTLGDSTAQTIAMSSSNSGATTTMYFTCGATVSSGLKFTLSVGTRDVDILSAHLHKVENGQLLSFITTAITDDSIGRLIGVKLPSSGIGEVWDGSTVSFESVNYDLLTDSLEDVENNKEDVANKSTDGTLSANSDVFYPSQKAVKTYVDTSVTGLLDFRGVYDASVNTWPATGGSGTSGAVKKADWWRISVAGTLGGKALFIGATIYALQDTPGQTAGNWAYVAVDDDTESTVNKDASGGYAGLTLLKINFKNVLNTFTSFFTNSNTAARTYTFPDRNGTVADDTDLATKQSTSGKDATGGYAGLTLFKINFKNALNTFTSFFTNANTAARTYTFQDRDGTVADDTDLGLKQSTSGKDATGGYTGMTLFKINFKNVLNTFTSFFTNSNTAARTYTFQDRDGIIADDTNLATKQNIYQVASAANLAALKALNTTSATTYPEGVVISVITLGMYYLSRASAATGDDITVIVPTTGAGRWIRGIPVTAIGGNTQVAFNKAGVMSGDNELTYDDSSNILSVLTIESTEIRNGSGDLTVQADNDVVLNASGNGIKIATLVGGDSKLIVADNNGYLLPISANSPYFNGVITTLQDGGAVATGDTIHIVDATTPFIFIIARNAATMVTGTLEFPSNPIDGQVIKAQFDKSVTSLTYDGHGHNVSGGPTTLAINGSVTFIYSSPGIGTAADTYRYVGA